MYLEFCLKSILFWLPLIKFPVTYKALLKVFLLKKIKIELHKVLIIKCIIVDVISSQGTHTKTQQKYNWQNISIWIIKSIINSKASYNYNDYIIIPWSGWKRMRNCPGGSTMSMSSRAFTRNKHVFKHNKTLPLSCKVSSC